MDPAAFSDDTAAVPPRRLPTVLVLASGRGERFRASGGTQHKLQAPLAGRAVLARTLDAVRASGLPWHLEDAGHPGMGDSIAAAVRATAADAVGWLVLPGDLPLVRPATLRRVAERLMAGSNAGAADADADADAGAGAGAGAGAARGAVAKVGPAADAARDAPGFGAAPGADANSEVPFAVVPRHGGVRGHPVGFAAGCRAALLDLKGNQGAAPVLRDLFAMNSVAMLELDDVGIVTDIDTLDDLRRAEALWAARPPGDRAGGRPLSA